MLSLILTRAARAAAAMVHAAVAEYRRLDEPPAAAEAARRELSCTQARIDARWQPQQCAPAQARALGFGLSGSGKDTASEPVIPHP
jgi:hypothetical protein